MSEITSETIVDALSYVNALCSSRTGYVHLDQTEKTGMFYNAEFGSDKDEINSGGLEFIDCLKTITEHYTDHTEEEEQQRPKQWTVSFNKDWYFTDNNVALSIVPNLTGLMRRLSQIISIYRSYGITTELLSKLVKPCENICCVGKMYIIQNSEKEETPILPICHPAFVYNIPTEVHKNEHVLITLKKYLNNVIDNYKYCTICLITMKDLANHPLQGSLSTYKHPDSLSIYYNQFVNVIDSAMSVFNNLTFVKKHDGTVFVKYNDNIVVG